MLYRVKLTKDEEVETYDIPYEFWQTVWYVYKKRKRWVIRKSKVDGIWATNIVGVNLDNQWKVMTDSFYRLFDNEDDAVEFCIKQNSKEKVKIYNRDS